jgi:ABC-type transport system involved in multi-copper enzyme maturation permease subunit
MRLASNQFVAVARLTALEIAREPVALVLATSGMFFIALLPALVNYTMGETQKLIRDSALALHFVGGLVLGSYAACSSLTQEIRRGTVSAVLSKPVDRGLFFLAKFAGVAAVMVLFSAGMAGVTLLSARMATEPYTLDWWACGPLLAAMALSYVAAALRNYFTQRPFVSSAFGFFLVAVLAGFVFTSFLDEQGHLTSFGAKVPWNILPASLLVTLAILVLTGVAVSLATRLHTVPTLSICSVVFLIGLMSDYLFGRAAEEHLLAAGLYGLIPNWQHFWVVDALSGGGTIPWGYVGQVAVYAVLYLAGVLGLGLLAFRHMEVRA